MNKRLANFNAEVVNYTWINNIYTAELFSSQSNVYTAWWGGGEVAPEKMCCRATTRVLVTETNVYKIEDHNHLNPNHRQEFTTWEELFFFFEN
jgi:hypothetical protein